MDVWDKKIHFSYLHIFTERVTKKYRRFFFKFIKNYQLSLNLKTLNFAIWFLYLL